MKKLTRSELYSLEQYSEKRDEFRAQIREHKKKRILHIGDHATLYFEDYLTMQYQVQEVLRVERTFTAEGIEDELAAYNPLIPDGTNWKATFMIEYVDEMERREALAKLIGIERTVWVQVDGFDKVFAIADEDLERETEAKTSSVHFLRFELDPQMRDAVKQGSDIAVGIDHPHYIYSVECIDRAKRDSLAQDIEA